MKTSTKRKIATLCTVLMLPLYSFGTIGAFASDVYAVEKSSGKTATNSNFVSAGIKADSTVEATLGATATPTIETTASASATPTTEASATPEATATAEVTQAPASSMPSEKTDTTVAPTIVSEATAANDAISTTNATDSSTTPEGAIQSPKAESAGVESGSTATPIPYDTFKGAFPDENLRKFVNKNYYGDKLKDTDIFYPEIKEVLECETGSLELKNLGLINLTGLSNFKKIKEIDVSYNNISYVDLKAFPNVETVDISYNDVTELGLNASNRIKTFNCAHNNITTLDLTGWTKLVTLHCENNAISALKFDGIKTLKYVYCYNNNIEYLSLTDLASLKKLYCENNALVSLDVSNLKKLTTLECRKSVVNLGLKTVGSDSGVVLPEDAAAPNEISNSGTYNSDNKAILWDTAIKVPASFSYKFDIKGLKKSVNVKINVDKSGFVEKAADIGKVTSLTTVSMAYNKIKLTWSNASGCSGYRIYRSDTADGVYTKIKTITKNSKVTYTDSTVACGTPYYYKVRAYVQIDGINYFGAYSPQVAGKAVPAVVKGLSVVKYSKKYVQVSFKKVTGATGYRVYRATKKNGGYTKIKNLTGAANNTFKKKTARKVKYFYKVRAYVTVNGIKIWGAYSDIKTKKLS